MTRTERLVLPQDRTESGVMPPVGVQGTPGGLQKRLLPKWPSLGGLVPSHTDSFRLRSHLKGKWARVGREGVQERLWGEGEMYR